MTKLMTFHVQLAVAALSEDDWQEDIPANDVHCAEASIKAALEHWRSVEGFFDGDCTFFTESILSVSCEASADLTRAPGAADIWGEHPGHAVADWQYEVANGDTRLGYWAWVATREEVEE